MPFCGKCGNEYQEGLQFCGKCGANVIEAAAAAANAAQQAPNQQPVNQQVPNQQPVNQQAPNQQAYNQQAPNQQAYNQQAPNQQAYNQQTPNQQAYNQHAPNQQAYNQQAPNQQAYNQQGFNQQNPNKKNAIDKLMNTKDYTGDFDPADINNNKVVSVISYLGFLVLVPLLAAKNSKFAQFHAKQGVTLFFVLSVFNSIGGFIANVLRGFFTKGGTVWGVTVNETHVAGHILWWIVTGIFGAVTLLFIVLGIVNAASGKAKRLPIIGNFEVTKVD